MDFKEVEAARQAYSTKKQTTSKKRKKIIAVAFSIALVIDFVITAFIIANNNDIFTDGSLILFIAVPVVSVIMLELILISIITYIATGGDSIAEEYQSYKRIYKKYFITRQLSSVFTDIKYDHERGLDEKLLQATGLINTGDIYSSNDLVYGKYKNVSFEQADVCIKEKHERTDKDGHTETEVVTVFRGRYLIFTFPKKFDYKMIVSPSGYGKAYFNPKTRRGLSYIETESTDFNKRFLVCAEDGFEAFYILNPAFIESLEKLGRQHNDKLALYFSDNKLYVGLDDDRDVFEPPDPSVPINEREETAKVTKDMHLITNLVDSLKLNK